VTLSRAPLFSVPAFLGNVYLVNPGNQRLLPVEIGFPLISHLMQRMCPGDPFHREITHFELVPCVYVLMYVWENGKSLHSVVSLDVHPGVWDCGHSPPPNPRLQIRFCTALRADRAERSLLCSSILALNGCWLRTRARVCATLRSPCSACLVTGPSPSRHAHPMFLICSRG
jgi:hypothetical protein